MNFTIKKATKKDAAQIVNLYQTQFLEPNFILEDPNTQYTTEDEEIEIGEHSTGNNYYAVAWSDKQIIGIIKFTGGHYQKNKHSGSFEIIVRKEFQKMGIASALLDELIAWAKESAISRIEIEVWANNKPAITLYKKFKFKKEGTKNNAYKISGRFIKSYIMAKLLNA